jgi:O-antigen ligase
MAAWGHSDTLTTLAESGFPAVLAFLGMLAMTGRTAFRRLPGNGTGMTMQGAMALGWVGWVLHGCFNDLLGNAA